MMVLYLNSTPGLASLAMQMPVRMTKVVLDYFNKTSENCVIGGQKVPIENYQS
jgi:hypothetical protein